MVTKVRKRDGSVVLFQEDKIADAIWKAARAVGGKDKEKSKALAKSVVDSLNKIYGEYGIPDVEEVQDLVEKTLIEAGHAKVSKAYILYRKSHDELRNVKGLFDTIEAVEDYIGLNDWMVKENSNMGFSLQGLNNYIATKIIANYWMRRVYPEAIRKVHEAGDLHIHDLGTLGAYCFDDKTKILTEHGWKYFKEVIKGEKVATKNLKTGKLEFQVPYAQQVFDYSGDMYSFEGRGVSLFVTPEHRLLVRRKHKKTWEFVNPTEFKYGMEFDKRVSWEGDNVKMFQVPNVKGGNRKKNVGKFDIIDYLEFMGWYLSEGSVYEPEKGDYRISIAQSRKKYRGDILKLLDRMKLNYNDSSEFNIHLHSKDLFYYLRGFGTSEAKYIPDNIKKLNSKMIKRFLIALFIGDGSFSNKGGLLKYYTKSKRLADDVVECLLKVGVCGTITRRKGVDIYMVSVENNHLTPIYRKRIVKKKYRGKVYDFSVRNGTLVVMREGKVVVSGNCVGWDLKDLLTVGFKGVKGKVESKPPKHLRTALGQIVNFFYTLQGETAGAQAFSNFDTLLAPFVRYDKLTYKEVRQGMQEFLFNMAVPTRVGFQCMSSDTEILTPGGWASYSELKKGDVIKTFNIEKKVIEDKPIKKLFAREYRGVMYNLRNRIQDQLISPGHRVVRKKFNTDNYVLEDIEEILKKKSPVIVPIAGENKKRDLNICDEKLKLLAWIISEGSIERPLIRRCCYRVSIYQSKIKNSKKYHEIKKLLNYFNFNYSEYTHRGLGEPVQRFRLNVESSKEIHKWFGTKESVGFIPQKLLNMSSRQSKLFLETYVKADGFEDVKIATTDFEILNGLQAIAVNAGYGSTVLTRNPTIGKKLIYILRLIKHSDSYIQKIEKVDYNGVIWCPNTGNETVIARRNGKVFITGNTPFTNLTMDLKVPSYMADEHVIIGGQPQMETYKDFAVEMEMINRAFAEGMLEGDAAGRVFTFPIPTYNITKDFDWDNKDYDLIWEMTAKYGIPYFSNFVNSDMNPEDARSMCPLDAKEKVLIKSSRGRGLEYANIGEVYNSQKTGEYEIYSEGKFIEGKFNKFSNQEMIKIILENNHEIKMSKKHLNYVISGNEEKILTGTELKKGMYLPYSLTKYNGDGGSKEMGYFVGAYSGGGSFDGDTSVVFSLEGEYKKEIIPKLTKIAKDYFGANVTVTSSKKSKLVTLRVHSRAAVGICKDFVEGVKREKHYKARLFGSSLEFREGVLEGHYATDGGNRNRIYTSSKKMVETLNMLAATLGTTTSVYKDERDGRFGTEPNYAVLVYKLNRKKYGDVWFKKENKLWMKIKEVREAKGDVAYCFEVKSGKSIFTIGTSGILTHNCRLRIDNTKLRKRGGGLFGANPLTGSIGVVTINMPRLGYVSINEDDFIARLDRLMELAKESLETKRKAIEKFTEVGLYPYSKFYLRQVHQRFGEYWKNHFSTIGLLGMNESIMNFLPGENITTEKGHTFAVKILDFMRKKLEEFQVETGSIYNLEATPGEGTTYRFARMDKKRFGKIIVANEASYKKGAKPYYTNSTQLPVNFTEDVFEALDLQDELQCRYTGGCIEKGNKVLTDKGLMRIEEVVNDFNEIKPIKVMSYNNKVGESEWDEVVDAVKIDVKKHDKIRVRGEKNLDIVTSDWHPFFILENVKIKSACPICKEGVSGVKGFVAHFKHNKICKEKYKGYSKYQVVERRADELKRGDYVLQNSFNLYSDKKTRIDSDLMWLIGFFIGDGCISKFVDDRGGNNIKKYKARFFSSNLKVLGRVKNVLFKKFGAEVSVIKNDKRSEVLREVGTSKKKVLDFFFKCGFNSGKKVYDVRIPDFVKNNFNSKNIFSFLSGLMDSDGHIGKRDGDLEYSTVSSGLADDLLEVFSVAGINVGKYKKEPKRANEKTMYRLRIPQYYLTSIKESLNVGVNVFNIKGSVSDRKRRHLPVVRVKECSKIDVEDNCFYDLTTKNNHNYLAGKDCLVFIHNTVFHTFIGEKLSKESVKAMVKKISYNYHLPYFTITPTFSVCPVHGYLFGEHEYCPKCDEELAEIEATPISVADDVSAEKELNEILGEPLEVPASNSQINLGGDGDGTNKM